MKSFNWDCLAFVSRCHRLPSVFNSWRCLANRIRARARVLKRSKDKLDQIPYFRNFLKHIFINAITQEQWKWISHFKSTRLKNRLVKWRGRAVRLCSGQEGMVWWSLGAQFFWKLVRGQTHNFFCAWHKITDFYPLPIYPTSGDNIQYDQ